MIATKRIAVIGAGGLGREVAWLIQEIERAQGGLSFAGFVVSDLSRVGPRDSADRLLGDTGWLEAHVGAVHGLALGMGDPQVRLRVAAELAERFPSLEWPVLVHPSVRLDLASSTLERGSALCAGVVGTVNVHVEEFALVNLSCTLGHESRVGRGSVLNPTTNVSGGVTIGEGVLIGTGAQLLQYLSVGARATVGAGAVVTKDVAPGATVIGVPARPVTGAGA